ncbi:uncharacterized protein LAESUDRAFT_318468 [Laetiporus sulphureus 93-53]|uniref:Uncharacterized protein n=1 Tax=Laetiporus sulphureus 93-53 TaxID=1314785 RepID=A0A165D112_9APHY|nr:uncharacterized protein LAESUDRAFT_318468 [Laetiporus sulphureus 93-53]KZT03921.1 hypothetical protein LAESUDRAFT_318468 [Laetiporus sulphureus 93-53]
MSVQQACLVIGTLNRRAMPKVASSVMSRGDDGFFVQLHRLYQSLSEEPHRRRCPREDAYRFSDRKTSYCTSDIAITPALPTLVLLRSMRDYYYADLNSYVCCRLLPIAPNVRASVSRPSLCLHKTRISRPQESLLCHTPTTIGLLRCSIDDSASQADSRSVSPTAACLHREQKPR